MNRTSRRLAFRNRMVLIAIGLLLGYAARWLVPPDSGPTGTGLFVPMPSDSVEVAPVETGTGGDP